MATQALRAWRGDRLFFTAMGVVVATIVFAGFARTYYLSAWWAPPARMPSMSALLHVHAVAFSLWILLGIVQPALIASGRRALHRRLGCIAAGLGALVWLLGNLASAKAMTVGYKGVGDPFAFYAVTFFSMQAFGLCLLLAIVKRRDGPSHKRLMLLSSAAILEAAFGRLPLPIIEQTAPLSFYVGSELILVAAILYDKASRGRVHPVWIWGGGVLVVSQLARLAVMQTPLWLGFAHAVAHAVAHVV